MILLFVRQVIEDVEKNIGKVGQFSKPFPVVDDRGSIQWKLGEDELSVILYLMDISDDLVSEISINSSTLIQKLEHFHTYLNKYLDDSRSLICKVQ